MNNFLNAEISLFISPEEKGDVKKGQPIFFLWESSYVSIFEEPSWFLYKRYVINNSTPSEHTWAAGAFDLKTWFQYLRARGIDWREAGECERESFCSDYARSISPRTGREFANETINRRLSIVKEFYSFARKQTAYVGDIGEGIKESLSFVSPIDRNFLVHTDFASRRFIQADSLLLKVGRKERIKPFLLKDLKKLRALVGVENLQENLINNRDRLIIDLGWVCGLRLNDVINLTTLKFLSLVIEPGQELVDFPILIEKGKFNVSRIASIPGWLILDIQRYISEERSRAIKMGKVKIGTNLFVGHANSKRAGRPISRNAIQKMINNACHRAGIIETVEFFDLEENKLRQKTVARHSYHDLRHNCAVFTYHAEKALGNPEPWKIVQIKLGHKSLNVTIDTYLSYVEIFGERSGITDMRRFLGL